MSDKCKCPACQAEDAMWRRMAAKEQEKKDDLLARAMREKMAKRLKLLEDGYCERHIHERLM